MCNFVIVADRLIQRAPLLSVRLFPQLIISGGHACVQQIGAGLSAYNFVIVADRLIQRAPGLRWVPEHL